MSAEQALIRLYVQTAKRLRAQIAEALASDNIGTAAYLTAQLRAIHTELRQLARRSRPLSLSATFEGYVRGAAVVDLGLGRTGVAAFEFTGTHPQAAQVIADNLASRLEDARQLVGRRTDDAFRRVALEVVGEGVVGGQTRREVSDQLKRRLVREGVTDSLTGFVDRRGARWQLDTYTQMVARTTTREAMSAGTRNRMIEIGEDLVTISDHSTETEICKAYEGRTFSLTGATPGYDVIDTLPPFHPNCWHVATPAAANLERLERELGIGAPPSGA